MSNVHSSAIDKGRPVALADYNQWMHGVDRSNQNSAYYRHEHKAIKWWKTIFISLMETAICNSYQLYRSPLQSVH